MLGIENLEEDISTFLEDDSKKQQQNETIKSERERERNLDLKAT